MKIGIVTYQNAINNGAILQAKGLYEKLKELFPKSRIEFINYYSPEMEIYELLKCFKLYRKKIFFSLKRYFKIKTFIPKFLKLSNEVYIGRLDRIIDQINDNYKPEDLIICGSDSIWKLTDDVFLPSFPNIYWLSEKIKSRKISYAASAYQYNKQLFPLYKQTITKILNSFHLISVRDSDTHKLVESLNLNKKVYKVPDPAFFYQIKKTGVDKILIKQGIDLTKPIFALITDYSNYNIMKIINYFCNENFQIIGLSMYNPLIKFNLGDELTPDEWGEVFKYVTFCVTDRFHGAIFCIKNKTPFIAIETKNVQKNRSKKFQLLQDFQLLYSYANIFDGNFDIKKAHSCVMKNWRIDKDKISQKIKKQIKIGDEFLNKLNK